MPDKSKKTYWSKADELTKLNERQERMEAHQKMMEEKKQSGEVQDIVLERPSLRKRLFSVIGQTILLFVAVTVIFGIFTEFNANKVNKTATTQTADKHDLILKCHNEISVRLKFPSSFNATFLEPGYRVGYQDEYKPYLIHVPFTAKNALGNKLPYLGVCVVEGDTVKFSSISER